MRRVGLILFFLVVTLLPVTTANAQYEGTNERFAREQNERRSESRSTRRWIRLGVFGAVMVGAGGMWVIRKIRGVE